MDLFGRDEKVGKVLMENAERELTKAPVKNKNLPLLTFSITSSASHNFSACKVEMLIFAISSTDKHSLNNED